MSKREERAYVQKWLSKLWDGLPDVTSESLIASVYISEYLSKATKVVFRLNKGVHLLSLRCVKTDSAQSTVRER